MAERPASWLAAWEDRAAIGGMDPNDRDFRRACGDWIEAERRAKK